MFQYIERARSTYCFYYDIVAGHFRFSVQSLKFLVTIHNHHDPKSISMHHGMKVLVANSMSCSSADLRDVWGHFHCSTYNAVQTQSTIVHKITFTLEFRIYHNIIRNYNLFYIVSSKVVQLYYRVVRTQTKMLVV